MTDLNYITQKIGGGIYCSDNKLTSLRGSPKIINGDFDCEDNKLTSLEFGPTEVNGTFDCSGNKLTSLEHCPKKINGNFFSKNNTIDYSIDDYPLCIIHGNIDIPLFYGIHKIIKENKEIFIHLLDDKIKFHQMVMRLDPSLISEYRYIPPPTKKSSLLV